MEKLEKSELIIAKILQMAIDSGLGHWQLSFADLSLDDSFAEFFYPSIEWLEAEGIVRVGEYARTLGGIANGSVNNIHLTSYGLRLLGQQITVGEKQVKLADEVKRVSQGDRSYSTLGDFVGGLLGGFTKSISS